MNKRRMILSLTALLLVAVFILPGLVYRIRWEQTSKVYVAAVDLNRVSDFFDEDQMPRVIADYALAGVTTAVINESRGQYPEELIRMAQEAGLNIALTPDVTVADDADLQRLAEQYNVKYIRLQKSKTKIKTEIPDKSEPVCRVIDEHDLTLVLTETIWQLENEKPVHYEDYLKAADGNILRTFNTYKKTNVDNKEYNAVYYQMYNSAYERNTRFITVLQLEDEGFTSEENAQRTQESIRLFCDKMESHGFVSEGTVDYNTYTPKLTSIRAAAAAVGVLMAVLIVEMLSKKELPWLLPVGLAVAAGAFGVSFVLPQSLLQMYPTLFVFIAPSFCIAVCAVYVEKRKDTMGFAPLALSAAGISLALLLFSGSVVTAMLSGPEYFLNELVFRGVKISLLLPMVFVAGLIGASVYKKRTVAEYKKLLMDAWHQIRWYHIVLFVLVGVVAIVYVIRSGNVNEIAFAEVYFRNLLTEVFTARPRTKEFLIGWPCLVLYIYYAKTGKSKLLQYVFAFGASILFASTVNTFCHVFTLAETMYLRVATGVLFGALCALAALCVNALLLTLVSHYETRRKN